MRLKGLVVSGFGFGVWGLGFGIWGLGLKNSELGFEERGGGGVPHMT